MASLLTLPVPPSRDPGTRDRQVPKAVRRRYEDFLRRVRSVRQGQGISQAAVAERIGISSSQYSNFERGYSMISVSKLFIVADVLGTTAGVLVKPNRTARAQSRP